MKIKSIISLFFLLFFISGCGILPAPFRPSATATLSLTPSQTQTLTLTPTKTRTQTKTPYPEITLEPYTSILPFKWPLPPLTEEQLDQVRQCDVESLAGQRYSNKKDFAEFYYQYEQPTSPCDWAVLAYAFYYNLRDTHSDDDEAFETAKSLFAKTIQMNPAFIFSTPLFYGFFNCTRIVEQPSFSTQEITRIEIAYTWTGMGDTVKYKVSIRQANTTPLVTVSNFEPSSVLDHLNTNLDVSLIQALNPSLWDLVPIDSQFSLVTCSDSNPDWSVSLTTDDESVIVLQTNGSNMMNIGGPWQTTINGQPYLQFSVGFIAALYDIIHELGLPFGQPMATACSYSIDVLDLAFP